MLAAAAAAIVLTLAAYVLRPAWLEKAELATVDARFAVRGDDAPGPEIVVVDLDDAGLDALGDGRDRIPREAHARMIDALREAGAGVIAYDFEFREPAAGDDELRAAIERAGPQLLLAATRIDSEGRGEVFGRPGDELSASVGYAGFPIAADDAYRQIDESVGLSGGDREEPVSDRLDSFAVVAAAARGAAGRTVRARLDRLPRPRRDLPPAPLRGRADEARARRLRGQGRRGRHLGAQAGRRARHGGGRRAEMSGAEIQANAISTLLRGLPLRGVGAAVDVALIILLGLLPAAVALALRARVALVAVVVAAAGALVLAQLLFSAGRILPVVYPLLALVLSAAGVAVARRAAVTRLR